ncbi:immunoglobulin-like domain-containing protein [Jeotgalibaca ciconiae]|uniref:Bacterial Ig-like domain-containing protein n=1 Tax=Jeotgalibaca ciconiae TaxID=2496265 RepID=A0A3S9HAE9_9LACT|nr:immunoglobulin-like domain-containing protein [Jeotgalibaca ciconiae]AZP04349.1 hypothetical protein EJN90_06655 [Jeotgalibaca ciconiae]HJB23518.1 hypothetical protein [Candidatus Jeotgalibaca pullicola]
MRNKKKGLFLFGMCLLIGTLSACGGQSSMEKSPYSEGDLNQLDRVSMSTTESVYPVGTSEIKVTISNETEEEYAYGVEFTVEKQEEEEWFVVPFEDGVAWIAIAHILAPNSENTETLSFDLLEKELEEGSYRVIKTIAGEPVLAMFTIEK